MKIYTFDDGVEIEWIDKETLRYSRGKFSVFVWSDFEAGFLKQGRVLHAEAIKNWDSFPIGLSSEIDRDDRWEILSRIMRYYEIHGKKCRIEGVGKRKIGSDTI